jgi:hypothetical protein
VIGYPDHPDRHPGVLEPSLILVIAPIEHPSVEQHPQRRLREEGIVTILAIMVPDVGIHWEIPCMGLCHLSD